MCRRVRVSSWLVVMTAMLCCAACVSVERDTATTVTPKDDVEPPDSATARENSWDASTPAENPGTNTRLDGGSEHDSGSFGDGDSTEVDASAIIAALVDADLHTTAEAGQALIDGSTELGGAWADGSRPGAPMPPEWEGIHVYDRGAADIAQRLLFDGRGNLLVLGLGEDTQEGNVAGVWGELVKYDDRGSELWHQTFMRDPSGQYYSIATVDMALDAQDNIYVLLQYGYATDEYSCRIVKLSPSNELLSSDGVANCRGIALTVTPQGRAILAAQLTADATLEGELSSARETDAFVMQFGLDDTVEWSLRSMDFVERVATDANGQVYVLGADYELVEVGEGPEPTRQAIIQKLSPDGETLFRTNVSAGAVARDATQSIKETSRLTTLSVSGNGLTVIAAGMTGGLRRTSSEIPMYVTLDGTTGAVTWVGELDNPGLRAMQALLTPDASGAYVVYGYEYGTTVVRVGLDGTVDWITDADFAGNLGAVMDIALDPVGDVTFLGTTWRSYAASPMQSDQSDYFIGKLQHSSGQAR